MTQSAGAVIFKPGDVFRHHIEFEDVSARDFREADLELNLRGFARLQITGQKRARVIPFDFFFGLAQQM